MTDRQQYLKESILTLEEKLSDARKELDRYEGEYQPGPWRFHVRDGCMAVYSGERLACFRGMAMTEFIFFRDNGDNPQDIATGRLIAEAPRMLEIVERLARSDGMVELCEMSRVIMRSLGRGG